jgi:hypothetical protein
MGAAIGRWLALAGAALALAGCGLADSHAFWPPFLRQAEAPVRQPDPEPDVAALVRGNVKSVFVESTKPRNVRVSGPRRDPAGYGWTACIKAAVDSIIGKPAGTTTLVLSINGGKVDSRRRAEPGDGCETESYTAI